MKSNTLNNILPKLAVFTTLLALFVIVLGAYTRLTDSGLGCPDWPGCYGRLIAPLTDTPIANVQVEPKKAWIEMIHRYIASSLGFLILLTTFFITRNKKQYNKSSITLSYTLLVCVIFQGLLGKWTVTMKLYPIVVLSHLLGGMTILSLSWLLTLNLNNNKLKLTTATKNSKLLISWLAIVSIFTLFLQIALGGWTSANYAALVCSDFPSCQGHLWPAMDWFNAFNLTKVGIFDSPGVPLENTARVTIQMAHRLGALLAAVSIFLLSGFSFKLSANKLTKVLSLTTVSLLVLQISLGITNIFAGLPLAVAVLHNGVAACLLLSTITTSYLALKEQKHLPLEKKPSIIIDYITLCKPRVVMLMMITSLVGMHLASSGFVPWQPLIWGTLGIGLAACSAAAFNHLLDRRIDGKMSRTSYRPVATGRITPTQAVIFSTVLGVMAMTILLTLVNQVTAWLTFATLFGYAGFYTVILKRTTPQNIVIGGAAGAMPPLLGWSAISGDINPYSLLLVLIIFVWTPPHFWALAIYKINDYAKAKIPMLPNTHGIPFTKLCILLYSILLLPITIFPYLVGMSGLLYLIIAIATTAFFVWQSYKLYKTNDNRNAYGLFNYSIIYLLILFIGLLLDHYLVLHILSS